VPNLNQPEFNDVREHPGFRARRARVGLQGGATKTGLSYWEVDPGEAAYPVDGGGISLWFRERDAVDYLEGVERTDA
jgi:hypothetical protein